MPNPDDLMRAAREHRTHADNLEREAKQIGAQLERLAARKREIEKIVDVAQRDMADAQRKLQAAQSEEASIQGRPDIDTATHIGAVQQTQQQIQRVLNDAQQRIADAQVRMSQAEGEENTLRSQPHPGLLGL